MTAPRGAPNGAALSTFGEGNNLIGTQISPANSAYTWDIQMYNSAKFIRDTSATADAVIFASPIVV